MENIELIVNVPEKILSIDGKPIRLENSFSDAYVDHADLEEPVVTLRYEDKLSRSDLILEIEEEKLRRTYSDKLFERLNISGGVVEEEYHINIYGKSLLAPVIIK